jgi:acetoin utilization deacetylase AcuC-like enzyme
MFFCYSRSISIIPQSSNADFANRCGCQVLSTHGGGYRLPVTVAAATAHVRTLATYESSTRRPRKSSER